MEDLIDLSDVVRRVVAARVHDVHLIEDLIQETLVRVAAAEPRLAPDARQAYAIVTARNVIVSHARSESVHERHAHRLVDYASLDGPEELALEREETDALTVALRQLDADDRELLLRHEAEGVSTDTLATETGTSKGAVAMRLARARATLRLEFLLAFRRVELPSRRCRQVLLALSAGDRRRQTALGAAAHLLRCTICAQLARPVAERRRGIAGWLFVPAADALHRCLRSLRHNRVTQVAVVAAATIAVVTGAVIARPDQTERTAGPAPTIVMPDPAPVSVSTTTAATTTTIGAGSCPAPLPLDQLDPSAAIGCPVAATTLTATDVPADEGFWAQTVSGQPVWVQMIGEGESPVEIAPGTPLVLVGTISDPAGAGPVALDPRITEVGFILQAAYADVTAA